MTKNVLKIPRKRPKTHGAWAFWKYGTCPAGKEFIVDIVDRTIRAYVDDLGGPDQVTAGQSVLLHNLRKVSTFTLLVDEHLSEYGIIDTKGSVNPALSLFYLSTISMQNRIIDKLGMKRVKGQKTWPSYLASREAALAKGQAPAPAAGQQGNTELPDQLPDVGEIVEPGANGDDAVEPEVTEP